MLLPRRSHHASLDRGAAALAAPFVVPAVSSAAEPDQGPDHHGDNVKGTIGPVRRRRSKAFLAEGRHFKVDVTSAPSKDLNDENLARYDVLLLNYKETPQRSEESRWSDANKAAFLKAVKGGGKGLVVHHFASAALREPELEGV